MIADDGWGVEGVRGMLSRRRFLALAGVSVLAGCGTAPRALATLTPTTALRAPTGRMTPDNAARITQLGVLRPEDGHVRGVAWAPNGAVVAAGGSLNVHLWSAATGQPLGTWRGHREQIHGMAWSPDGGLLASASEDGTVRLWNPRAGTAAQVLSTRVSWPVSVAWSPDGRRLVCGTVDGRVMLWDAGTGGLVATWTGSEQGQQKGGIHRYPMAVWGVSWSPDGRRVASTRYDGLVQVWDASSGASLAVRATNSRPNGVAWSPDGTLLASSGDDGSIQLWETQRYGNTATLLGTDVIGWTYPLGWLAGEPLLCAAGSDGTVRWWDTRSRGEVAALTGHEGAVWGLAVAPDGTGAATGGDDTTVRLWGVR